jgi:sugar/nucleoside kinase (ribokinase family)
MSILVVGHPVVDRTAFAEGALIRSLGLPLGESTRVTPDQLTFFLSEFPDSTRVPGGSGPNTGSALTSLGHQVSLIGSIGQDVDGDFLADAYRDSGIQFLTSRSERTAPTSRSLILIARDGDAATAIALGATEELRNSDLEIPLPDLLQAAYVEGRIIDQVGSAGLVALAHRVRDAGAPFFFSLGGKRQALMHQHELLVSVLPECDFIFGTEEEFASVSPSSDWENTVRELSTGVPTLVVTKGASGVTLAHKGSLTHTGAAPVSTVVDSTGAGDAFAAGYIAAHLAGADPDKCVAAGDSLARYVIQRRGSWVSDPVALSLTSLLHPEVTSRQPD